MVGNIYKDVNFSPYSRQHSIFVYLIERIIKLLDFNNKGYGKVVIINQNNEIDEYFRLDNFLYKMDFFYFIDSNDIILQKIKRRRYGECLLYEEKRNF